MNQNKPIIDGCRFIEDMNHLRLMALLQGLIRDKGKMATAQMLGVNHKTLARSMQAGMLSTKTRWALERLQYGEGSVAVKRRERNDELEDRLDELEEELRSGLEEMRTALDGQREEYAGHLRRVERQVAALLLGHAGTGPENLGPVENGGSGTRSGPPWWRPGAAAQRKVEDLIYEWRQARNSLIAAEERLSIALDWDMVADLTVRDESAETFGEPHTPRSAQLSKRKLALSETDDGAQTELGGW